MELCSGWLAKAIALLDASCDVAAVSGPWIDLPTNTTGDAEPTSEILAAGQEMEEVCTVGGAAIYRRSVLEKVGPFNPYLYSDEEPELCVRIRHAGYRIVRLKYTIAYHYSDPKHAVSTVLSRRRRNLYLGLGQVIRYHLGSELLWPYIRQRGYGCVPGFGLVVGLTALLATAVTHRRLWFSLWLLVLIGLAIGDGIRKRSAYRVLLSVVIRMVTVEGTIRGLLIAPDDPRNYLERFEVVRAASPG